MFHTVHFLGCYNFWNRKRLTNDFEVLAQKKSVQAFIEYIVYISLIVHERFQNIECVFFLVYCLFVRLMESEGYEQVIEGKRNQKCLC